LTLRIQASRHVPVSKTSAHLLRDRPRCLLSTLEAYSLLCLGRVECLYNAVGSGYRGKGIMISDQRSRIVNHSIAKMVCMKHVVFSRFLFHLSYCVRNSEHGNILRNLLLRPSFAVFQLLKRSVSIAVQFSDAIEYSFTAFQKYIRVH
jgi:hypothetical protein